MHSVLVLKILARGRNGRSRSAGAHQVAVEGKVERVVVRTTDKTKVGSGRIRGPSKGGRACVLKVGRKVGLSTQPALKRLGRVVEPWVGLVVDDDETIATVRRQCAESQIFTSRVLRVVDVRGGEKRRSR